METQDAPAPPRGRPGALAARAVQFLSWLSGYRGIPYLARHTFRYEFIGVFTFALAAAAMEGSFAQLFAAKTLHAPDWVIAAVLAGGAVGNFTAALSAPLLTRQRQVPLLVVRLLLCGVLLALVSLLPASTTGSYIFVVIMLVMAMLNATAVNARTSLWQANYPDHIRGQVISRFIIVGMAMVILLVLVQSTLMDRWPYAYRLLFVLGGLAAMATAGLYARLRIRGETARLRRQRQAATFNPLEVVKVLRNDRLFAQYMLWQMVLGSATLMVDPVLVIILRDTFRASYLAAALPLVLAPMMMTLLTTPYLGRLYDTVNIFVYRSTGAAFWGIGRFVLFVGVWLTQWPALAGSAEALPGEAAPEQSATLMPLLIPLAVVFLGRLITGLGGSFGSLAWSLGHLNFARPEKAPLYLGAHMLLTGIRGAIMPFVGILLYRGVNWSPFGIAIHLHAIGIHVIWVSGMLHMLAAYGMWQMRNRVPWADPRVSRAQFELDQEKA